MKKPTILSLDDLQIKLSEDVRKHLETSYRGLFQGDNDDDDDGDSERLARQHMDRVLAAMKTPPKTSICRVNFIQSDRSTVMQELQQVLSEWIKTRDGGCCEQKHNLKLSVQPHHLLDDVVCVNVMAAAADETTLPLSSPMDTTNSCSSTSSITTPPLCAHWPERETLGWPKTHRVVLVDRYCGEAVLRGSDIFVSGVLSADSGIQPQSVVAVYANIGPAELAKRGVRMEDYVGRCVFLGLGVAQCKKADFFSLQQGVGVEMMPRHRAGPVLPPLSGVHERGTMMVQNLPSILVAHVLDPQPSDVILDMCAAPGGKTLHLASRTRNKATIVACDRSRRRILSARSLFQQAGATCIEPLVLDSSYCVDRGTVENGQTRKSVVEVSNG